MEVEGGAEEQGGKVGAGTRFSRRGKRKLSKTGTRTCHKKNHYERAGGHRPLGQGSKKEINPWESRRKLAGGKLGFS